MTVKLTFQYIWQWLCLFLISGWAVSGCAPLIPLQVSAVQPDLQTKEPAPTRSSIALTLPQNTLTPAGSPSPVPTLTLTRAPVFIVPPEPSPTSAPLIPPLDGPGQPVPVAESWAKPWQYFSTTLTAGGPILYRLRYPPGWYAYIQSGGSVTLQNLPAGQALPGRLEPGIIRVEISASLAEKTGGLPAPNTRTLAAGRPGTRQVLLDSSLGLTIWGVRLYGIVDDSVALNLVGWLNLPEQETEEGIRLLDSLLATLEVYSWIDPTPAPVPLDGTVADTWEVYSGRLEAATGAYPISFRYPNGWWLDQDGSRRIDLTNYVIVGSAVGEPLPAGALHLSISAASCTEAGGCPLYPTYLSTGLPGRREVIQTPGGETSWIVRIFQGSTQIILYASMNGSPHQVAEQIQALDMVLRTLQLR